MKIMRRGTVMRNHGCPLVQEDWSEDYAVHKPGDQLAAFPVSTAYSGRPFGPSRGETFRLGMHFPSPEEASKAFNDLVAGKTKLEDYVSRFDTTPGMSRKDILSYL